VSRRWQRTLPHDVYEITDSQGRALYVGMSMNTERRLLQHRSKPWFTTAAMVRISTFVDQISAKHAEGRRISELNPLHNLQREHWAAAQAQNQQPIRSREEPINHGR
jgi:hypothetical protein